MTQADRVNQQIKLRDGRRLGYAEYGHPDGSPIFFCHGFPGSRRDWLIFDSEDVAVDLKARIIAVDRPGMGLSDFQANRGFLDWPDDVIEMADALRVDHFAVLAISGGGPYGDVCAFRIAERLTATAIVSGMGPSEAPGAKDGTSWIFPGKPSLIRRLILTLMAQGLKNPDRMLTQINGSFSGPDGVLMEEHPDLAAMVAGSWKEAFRAGIGGVHHEAGLYTRPWGYRLQDITAPVYLWHGGLEDKNVPGSVGHYVADSIPDCRPTFFEDEGHFSLIYNHMEDILDVLVS
jgi:pimeloyl-ACP methyl ester carboxylesterase